MYYSIGLHWILDW